MLASFDVAHCTALLAQTPTCFLAASSFTDQRARKGAKGFIYPLHARMHHLQCLQQQLEANQRPSSSKGRLMSDR